MRNGVRKSINQINLPEHFVDSLRILFDILDTSRTGFISYEQLESKWLDLPIGHLPANFLECVRQVTPHSGMLTFERFLAGVRLSLQDSNIAKLHRVRSEGKLDEISYNNNRKKTKKSNDSYLPINQQKLHHQLNTSIFSGNVRGSALPAMGLSGIPRNGANGGALCAELFHRTRSQSATPFSTQNFPKNKEDATKSSNKSSQQNYSIVMRSKKNKSMRAPLPPTQIQESDSARNNFSERNSTIGTRSCSRTFRPLSTNSIGSICSSGMTDLKWRDSQLSASPTEIHNSASERFENGTGYAEEHKLQVVKHEQLLAEELQIVQKGLETTKSLINWYENRLESLEKRKKMLDKGMVALDSAVHEQKLNFYRAQITELNRRMKTLILSSEYGFPNHANMIQIRSQIQPKPQSLATKRINSGYLGSESCTSASSTTSSNISSNCNKNNNNNNVAILSSNNSSPEPHFQQNQSNLHMQQQKLIQELENKSKLIEQLQYENRVYESRQAQFLNGIVENSLNNGKSTNSTQNDNYQRIGRVNGDKRIGHISPAIATVLKPMPNNNNNYQNFTSSRIPATIGIATKIHDTLL